jgi:hypothetical protein
MLNCPVPWSGSVWQPDEGIGSLFSLQGCLLVILAYSTYVRRRASAIITLPASVADKGWFEWPIGILITIRTLTRSYRLVSGSAHYNCVTFDRDLRTAGAEQVTSQVRGTGQGMAKLFVGPQSLAAIGS